MERKKEHSCCEKTIFIGKSQVTGSKRVSNEEKWIFVVPTNTKVIAAIHPKKGGSITFLID